MNAHGLTSEQVEALPDDLRLAYEWFPWGDGVTNLDEWFEYAKRLGPGQTWDEDVPLNCRFGDDREAIARYMVEFIRFVVGRYEPKPTWKRHWDVDVSKYVWPGCVEP